MLSVATTKQKCKRNRQSYRMDKRQWQFSTYLFQTILAKSVETNVKIVWGTIQVTQPTPPCTPVTMLKVRVISWCYMWAHFLNIVIGGVGEVWPFTMNREKELNMFILSQHFWQWLSEKIKTLYHIYTVSYHSFYTSNKITNDMT